jgi:RNA polymerase sigma-70 factor (ECF subfamily)
MRESGVERELVARVRAGEADAVTSLAASYGPRIQQLAFRYLRNWEDAEEVTQDVLLKVVRKIDGFRGDAALSSWIYRITFNAAMSRLRSARFSRPNEVNEHDVSPSADASWSSPSEPADWSMLADDEVMRAEMRKRLVEALAKLPDVYRIPVILRDVHGLSTEEAAVVLRVKTQTLKSRLHRGRLILRERLTDFAGGLSLHGGQVS